MSSVALRIAALRRRDVDRLLVEVALHQLVVVLGDGLEQVRCAPRGRRPCRSAGISLDLGLLAEVVLVDDRLLLDEVDDALEVALGADRKLDRDGVRAEAVDHRLDALVEVRADAVHLVDVGDARDAVLVGLAPDGLGLRLDAGDRVEQRDRAVEHAQRALDLDGEVDVARRVDDVDAVVAPGGGGRGGRDRDAALLLLLHPVHHGGALVDLAHLVGAAGVVEDALGRRRLAGVDVRHDADVARLLEWKFLWPCQLSLVPVRAEKRPFPGPVLRRFRPRDSCLCGRGLHRREAPASRTEGVWLSRTGAQRRPPKRQGTIAGVLRARPRRAGAESLTGSGLPGRSRMARCWRSASRLRCCSSWPSWRRSPTARSASAPAPRRERSGVCTTTGGDAHGYALWLIAAAGAGALALGAGGGRSRPARWRVIVCGLVVLVIAAVPRPPGSRRRCAGSTRSTPT